MQCFLLLGHPDKEAPSMERPCQDRAAIGLDMSIALFVHWYAKCINHLSTQHRAQSGDLTLLSRPFLVQILRAYVCRQCW